ncbi:MAG: sigma-70 family RNA polymerase sigma factor [Sedimentisphaerales bacterium]|nr:sigma-70 family RNA polymerase sigma factor [Sedimentisphaerales bacterium]
MNEAEKLKQIVSGCKRGDNQACSELVDIYADRCYGYFYRLTGNTNLSNDLLGELFLKLVEKINTYNEGSFNKWIFTVASNIFRDHLRQKYRFKKLMDTKISQVRIEAMSQDSTHGGEIADKLEDMIKKLDDDTAELITLRFYGQLSFKELAELREVPIGTVLSKVHRGLKRLKELMSASDE